MKKYISFLLAALVSITVVLFPGCKKHDYTDPAQRCRITSITGTFDNGVFQRLFTYDTHGNPVSVRYPENQEGTGFPHFTFWYNSKNQLLGYDGFATHNYTYNTKGVAILDTVISNYAGQDARYAEQLFYDNHGRIVKVISKLYHYAADDPDRPTVGEVMTTEYKYDSRGNLILPGVAYDNKSSLYRTNTVWMLVHRNYSVNNEIPGPLTYNAVALPATYGPSFSTFLSQSLALAEINYDCGGK